jgi:hypothetical protein
MNRQSACLLLVLAAWAAQAGEAPSLRCELVFVDEQVRAESAGPQPAAGEDQASARATLPTVYRLGLQCGARRYWALLVATEQADHPSLRVGTRVTATIAGDSIDLRWPDGRTARARLVKGR